MSTLAQASADARAPRRTYYRLDHRIPFAYRRVSDADSELLQQGQMPVNVERNVSPTARLAALRVEANLALNHLRQEDPVVGRYLQTIESRLEIIAEKLFEDGRDDFRKTLQDINLSASGVAFRADEELPVGTWLEVEFDLPETKVSVHAYALVVRCCEKGDDDTPNAPCNVGAQMQYLSVTEREMIVAYMLGRQAERIRRDRERLGV